MQFTVSLVILFSMWLLVTPVLSSTSMPVSSETDQIWRTLEMYGSAADHASLNEIRSCVATSTRPLLSRLIDEKTKEVVSRAKLLKDIKTTYGPGIKYERDVHELASIPSMVTAMLSQREKYQIIINNDSATMTRNVEVSGITLPQTVAFVRIDGQWKIDLERVGARNSDVKIESSLEVMRSWTELLDRVDDSVLNGSYKSWSEAQDALIQGFNTITIEDASRFSKPTSEPSTANSSP